MFYWRFGNPGTPRSAVCSAHTGRSSGRFWIALDDAVILLDRLAHLAAVDGGEDLLHAPILVELVDGHETELVQKPLCGAPQLFAMRPQVRGAGDQTPIAQALDGGGAFDPADGTDRGGGDRLRQGRHGQGLESLRGEGFRPAAGREFVDEVGVLGLGFDADPFRATGITVYLKNSSTLEKPAFMANHASIHTTQLYDRRRDKTSLDDVERILL